jgi:pimeloyl-ACP methyl ester carboxylesterase
LPGIKPEVWARVGCGTLKVPLDYDDPEGDWITIAATRLRATDPARRRGILAFNPGGPGGAGFLMPAEIVSKSAARTLADDLDLIGFDPRGVGHSSKVECALPPMQAAPEILT